MKSIPPKASVSIPEYKPSRAPEVAFADVVDEVKRLEAAIEVLGGDNVHAKGLQAAFRSARPKTKVLPVSERIEACKMFVERTKKRVQRVQEVVNKALSQKVVHEAEVAEGERRLVTATDRCSGARTRRIAGQSPQGWQVDGQWTPVCREHPSHAKRPSGFGGLARGSYLWFGRTRSDPVGVVGSRPRCAHGRPISISSHVKFDRRPSEAVGPRCPGVGHSKINSRNGLRVGEASNPGGVLKKSSKSWKPH